MRHRHAPCTQCRDEVAPVIRPTLTRAVATFSLGPPRRTNRRPRRCRGAIRKKGQILSTRAHVLPILIELADQLDRAFIETVGPFGELVVAEARSAWLAAGPRIRTRDIEDYVVLLADEVGDAEARKQFLASARAVIGKY